MGSSVLDSVDFWHIYLPSSRFHEGCTTQLCYVADEDGWLVFEWEMDRRPANCLMRAERECKVRAKDGILPEVLDSISDLK